MVLFEEGACWMKGVNSKRLIREGTNKGGGMGLLERRAIRDEGGA